jgi:hypothetical protein
MNDNWSNLKQIKRQLKKELQSEWTKPEGIGEKKNLDELKELNDKIQNEELLTSWINLNKTVIKPKFRTVGGA